LQIRDGAKDIDGFCLILHIVHPSSQKKIGKPSEAPAIGGFGPFSEIWVFKSLAVNVVILL
jgi:hypothetical protein